MKTMNAVLTLIGLFTLLSIPTLAEDAAVPVDHGGIGYDRCGWSIDWTDANGKPHHTNITKDCSCTVEPCEWRREDFVVVTSNPHGLTWNLDGSASIYVGAGLGGEFQFNPSASTYIWLPNSAVTVTFPAVLFQESLQ